eukprot:CAMPEP_0194068256 /NCGR_PEP_ID=MMETSP0009_2-20130614/86995_1 /TAXON_ID=210454 /ORGANISM="Grammatophora oceanica, Strain CCMP 410" /LENGTH=383 /DNA_ID=CAMNT_0038721337 /DNA_START=69 /DNA_END=1217 /DNA_ORIENTATION=-
MRLLSFSFHTAMSALLMMKISLGSAFSVEVPSTSANSGLSTTTLSTPILTPSDEEGNDVVSFDTGCVANPVVLPPDEYCSEWQCYYYGNAGSWNFGHKCFLPTGSSGLAVSEDGLSSWTKIAGEEADGSILKPSSESEDWDSVQTGVGDVIRINRDELHMYYFGGSNEEISMGPGSIVGFRMRIGRAKSKDNGRTWTKDDGFVLDYDESEGIFASWPRIVRFEEHRPWKMYYHSFDGSKWRVFGAESSDEGDTWTRTGLVLEGGESEDAFDFSGIGTRSITKWRDGLLMIYEGVASSGTHRLGAAFCDIESNTWKKLNEGEPILEPGKGPLGEWTKQVVGTPYVITMPDSSLRVYHCAKDGPQGKMKIGVVVSPTGDIEADCW